VRLDFQGSGGNLVLYGAATTATAALCFVELGAKATAAEVRLQDDCKLVTYSSGGAALGP
jgi:hypothetical protein